MSLYFTQEKDLNNEKLFNSIGVGKR